jgi:geranylgeranyl diphosphate synthase type II
VIFSDLKEKYAVTFEDALRNAINFKLENDERNVLKDAIRHSVETPGKRIRPLICMAIENSLKNSIKASLPIGISIELIHCYSLIHDDLPAMDNDDFRRGVPTCHKAFGEDVAILAGDTLNTYAFEFFTSQLKHIIPPNNLIEMIIIFADACGIKGMAGGQILDLKSANIANKTIEDLKKIHRLKTGALLKACFDLTTLAITDDSKTIKLFSTIGEHFGLLFQIIDDILDEVGTLEELGKSPGKDAEQAKLTYVSKLGLSGARDYARDEYNKIIDLCNQLECNTSELESIINYVFSKGIDNEH